MRYSLLLISFLILSCKKPSSSDFTSYWDAGESLRFADGTLQASGGPCGPQISPSKTNFDSYKVTLEKIETETQSSVLFEVNIPLGQVDKQYHNKHGIDIASVDETAKTVTFDLGTTQITHSYSTF